MMMDPKKAAMSILKGRKSDMPPAMPAHPSSAKELPSKDSDGDLDPRHMAAEDVMQAIKEQHVGKLRDALANFHDIHAHKMNRDMESDLPQE